MEIIGRLSTQPKIHRVIEQPRKIYQTPDEKHFNIDIKLRTCVHGYLSWAKRQPASLIVFEVQFACIGRHGSFKRIKLRVDFEDLPGPGADASPNIISHAPFEFEERENITEAQIQRTHGMQASASANINLVGGSGGAKLTLSREEISKHTAIYFGRGAAATVANDKGVSSGVWWNIKQSTNPVAKDDTGISPNYCFAVLVTRQDDADFQARLDLLIDAGWRHKAENHFSSKLPVKGQCPSLLFSPSTHYEGKSTGIDRNRLGRFKESVQLEQLTWLN